MRALAAILALALVAPFASAVTYVAGVPGFGSASVYQAQTGVIGIGGYSTPVPPGSSFITITVTDAVQPHVAFYACQERDAPNGGALGCKPASPALFGCDSATLALESPLKVNVRLGHDFGALRTNAAPGCAEGIPPTTGTIEFVFS